MIKVKRPFGYYDTALGIIGRTGENYTRTIDFDCAAALKEYPNANIICVCLRPGDDEPYTIPLSTDGDHRVLTLSSADLEKEGRLTLELRMVDGDKVLKSARFTGTVASSLQGEGDAPGMPVRDTLDRLDAEIKAAQAVVDDIRAKLDAGEFDGPQGPKGDPGSDASVTAESIQSALGYAPVKDVQMAGTSVLENGVANVPIAQGNAPGVVSVLTPQDSGILNDNGSLRVSYATDAEISSRTGARKAIVCANMDYAVKAAMCDGKGAAWTAGEQKAARERMGIPGNFELLHSITVGEGGVTQVDIPPFPALHHIMALVTMPPIAPFNFFLRSTLSPVGSYIAGTVYGNNNHTFSIRFEIGIEGGIAFARSSGYIEGWGGGTMIGPNKAGKAVFAQSITSADLYTPPNEGKVIPEATKIEIYGVKI